MALQSHLAAGVPGTVLGSPSSPHWQLPCSRCRRPSSTPLICLQRGGAGRTLLPSPFPQPGQNWVAFCAAFMAEMVLNISWSGNLSSYCFILKQNKAKIKGPFLFVVLLIAVLQHFPRPITYCLGRLAECKTYHGLLYSDGSWKKSSWIQALTISCIYPNAGFIYIYICINIYI